MKAHILAIVILFNLCPVWAQVFSLDEDFKVDFTFEGGADVFGVIVNPDGTLLYFGDFYNHPQIYIAKFKKDGPLVASFIVQPFGLSNKLTKVEKTDYGYWLHYTFGMNKIDESGNYYVPGFLNKLPTLDPQGMSVHLPDGKVISGCFPVPCYIDERKELIILMRLMPDGQLDTTFRHYPNGGVGSILKQNDSTLFLSGLFTEYDEIPCYGLAKVSTNGTLDTSFKSPIIFGDAMPIYVQADGKLIISGAFVLNGITETLGLARLMPDGSLDSTFNFKSIREPLVKGWPNSVCPTTDGGYIMVGAFTEFDGHKRGNIVKTDSNGFIETAYFNGTGFDSHPIPSLMITPSASHVTYSPSDDYYYVSGWFNGYNGKKVQPVVRFRGFTSSIEENQNTNGFSIYPVPAKHYLNIEPGKAFHAGTSMISIYNSLGKLIREEQLKQPQQAIDISLLENGLYFISLQNERTYACKKFIKE